jgi:hypothetical protein
MHFSGLFHNSVISFEEEAIFSAICRDPPRGQLACTCTAVRPACSTSRSGLALEIFDGALRVPKHAANMPEISQGHRPWIASRLLAVSQRSTEVRLRRWHPWPACARIHQNMPSAGIGTSSRRHWKAYLDTESARRGRGDRCCSSSRSCVRPLCARSEGSGCDGSSVHVPRAAIASITTDFAAAGRCHPEHARASGALEI